ncbi:hypothetical protein JXA34_03545 [Patescibacteria group bacterium]|nr:hypothetical protein [Patescibacteria group bacterium]
MRKWLYSLSFLSFTLTALFFLKQPIFADGAMIVRPDPYSDRWDYGDEESQQAYINYEYGVQKMILAIKVGENYYSDAVWIFPVPSLPEKVTIDVVKELPNLTGEDISILAERTLDRNRSFLLATQIYPIPFLFIHSGLSSMNVEDVTLGGGEYGVKSARESDVEVHETITKEGITTELVTAKTSEGLYNYLKDKDLDIKANSIDAFDNYIGKDYSFVVSWISNKHYYYYDSYKPASLPGRDVYETGEDMNPTVYGISDESGMMLPSPTDDKVTAERPIPPPRPIPHPDQAALKGVFVTFPTKDIYYPLIPTSVYGSKKVPAAIRVMGHVTPRIFEDIKAFSEVNYYFDEYSTLQKDFYRKAPANNRYTEDVMYTKIDIEAPSKLLTQDLWIKRLAPAYTYPVAFVALNSFWTLVLFLISCSLFTGIVVGKIVFGKSVSLKKCVVLGLSNCLSLLGVVYATVILSTKENTEDVSDLMKKLKDKGYLIRRRIALFLCIANLPFLVLGGLFFIGLVLEILRGSMSILEIPLAPVVPFIVLVIVKKLRHIKDEDKDLFRDLKKKGYSPSTMSSIDPKKLIFISVFSVLFIVNVLCLGGLLKLML